MTDNFISWEQAVVWLRQQPEQLELVCSCYYDDPLFAAAKRFAASIEWLATVKLLPHMPGRALDFGAGRGISSYALAAAGWQVTALEPDSSDLVGTGAINALAKESQLPITVANGYAEEMEFDNNSFDLVYTREVLHHARDLNSMMCEAARVLKPGGMFFACREHVISNKLDLQVFKENHALHHLYGGEYAFLLGEYLAAIHTSGLKVKRIYGNYETAINYFPLSEDRLCEIISSPVRKLVGSRLTDFLFNSQAPWFDKLVELMAALRTRFDDTPGRLYTFVAIKPL